MSKRNWIILAVVVAAAAAAYFGYRYFVLSRQQEGQNPQGLGSNLNSPAPQIGAAAAPSVGPAVEIPVSISIAHSASEEPEAAANPYRRMISDPDAIPSPLRGGGGNMRPATRSGFRLAQHDDFDTDKDAASPYSTTMGPG